MRFILPTVTLMLLVGAWRMTAAKEPAERATTQAQWDGFMAALDGIGISRRLAERWTWWPAQVVKVRVTAVFVPSGP